MVCAVLHEREYGAGEERRRQLTAQVVNSIVAFMFSVQEPRHFLHRKTGEMG